MQRKEGVCITTNKDLISREQLLKDGYELYKKYARDPEQHSAIEALKEMEALIRSQPSA